MFYRRMHTHMHPHSIYALYICYLHTHGRVCILKHFQKVFLSLSHNIARAIFAGSTDVGFVSSCSRSKVPWVWAEEFLSPVSSPGLRRHRCVVWAQGLEAVHSWAIASPLQHQPSSYQIHSLLFSRSWGHVSQRAEDKQFLLSEKWGRIPKSTNLHFMILALFPNCSSFLELLPSFMIQATTHFHLNHSLKHTFSVKPPATDDWIWQKQCLNSEQGFCLSKLFGE